MRSAWTQKPPFTVSLVLPARSQEVLRMVSRLKDTRTPVLISGESGTGKNSSPRYSLPRSLCRVSRCRRRLWLPCADAD